MTFYIVDVVLAGLLAFGAVRGFAKGLVAQLFSLAALLLGIWGAIRFSDYTATLVAERFSISSQYLPLVSFAITFAAIVVGVHFLGKLIESFLNLTILGLVNKVSGLVFGVVKSTFILSVVIVLVEKANVRVRLYSDRDMAESYLYSPLSRLAPAVFPYLNFESIRDAVREHTGVNSPEETHPNLSPMLTE